MNKLKKSRTLLSENRAPPGSAATTSRTAERSPGFFRSVTSAPSPVVLRPPNYLPSMPSVYYRPKAGSVDFQNIELRSATNFSRNSDSSRNSLEMDKAVKKVGLVLQNETKLYPELLRSEVGTSTKSKCDPKLFKVPRFCFDIVCIRGLRRNLACIQKNSNAKSQAAYRCCILDF